VTEIETAKNFIRARLAEGPVLQKEIEAAAREIGIASRTLRRAKEAIGVVAWKEKGSLLGRWFWRMPPYEYDSLSTKGRSRVWLVGEAIAAKRANRTTPRYEPDEGGRVAT
jgi:hypothetical protein